MMQPKLSLVKSWRRWAWWRDLNFQLEKWLGKIWRGRFIFITLAIGVSAFLTFTRLPFFQISEVLVSGSLTVESSSRVKDLAARQAEGQNFFLLASAKLAKELLANFPALKKVEVRKIFPHKVLLTVEQRTPLAIVEQASAEVATSYLIDQEGIYFALAQDVAEKLTVIEITSASPPMVGAKASVDVLAALATIEGLKADFPDLVVVKVTEDSSLEVNVPKDLTIIFSSKKSIASQLATLRKVWGKYKMENKPLRRVDLRYANPIVAF